MVWWIRRGAPQTGAELCLVNGGRGQQSRAHCGGAGLVIVHEHTKYFTELGLNVTVLGQYLGRQRDLERLTTLPEVCNLYIVTRRPRISIEPSTVSFRGGLASGIVRVQRGEQFDEIPFTVPTRDLGKGPFRYKSAWPYDEFSILNSDGESVSRGVVALAAVAWGMLDARRVPHEVLYVGQAFGKAGERTAFDRLRSHSTLQLIYAENRPDQEIWLHLCRVSDLTMMMEFNPLIRSRSSDPADEEHRERVLRRMHARGFDDHEAIAIGEAGLIRRFDPIYNEKFKNNYPDPKHVHIATCYDLELATISVEFQGHELMSFYYSEAAPRPAFFFVAQYSLHETAGFITAWHGGRPRHAG